MLEAGSYQCIVENDAGKCESSLAVVTVKPISGVRALEIIEHPMLYKDDLTLGIGQELTLKCLARSLGDVHFTWFVNGRPLQGDCAHYYEVENASISQHSHRSLLTYKIPKDAESSLKISCEAASNGERMMSNEVCLTVGSSEGPRPAKAGHKLALLIAMSKYNHSSMTNLDTPPSDIVLIARELSALNFQCFTFNDLNYIELLSAIKFFSSLVKPGDYVLFYYGGHGYFNGVNQLLSLPQDNELFSLPMPSVMAILQENDPSLLFVVLDTCKHLHMEGGLENIARVPAKRNTITLHATSVGYQSLEEKRKTSILTTALVKHLKDPVDVITMARRVCDDIQNSNSWVRKEQIPTCDFDLCGSLKLSDPISRMDDKRLLHWSSVFQLPQRKIQKVSIGTWQCTIEVMCRYPDTNAFTNSMLILFQSEFLGRFTEKPAVLFRFDRHREYISVVSQRDGLHVFKVDSLQRLKESLIINMELSVASSSESKQVFFDLGLPGLPKACPWEE